MPTIPANNSRSFASKLILLLSIFSAAYCVLASFINVYRFAIVGVIYEILWLPALGVLFIAPLVAIVLWKKEKFRG